DLHKIPDGFAHRVIDPKANHAGCRGEDEALDIVKASLLEREMRPTRWHPAIVSASLLEREMRPPVCQPAAIELVTHRHVRDPRRLEVSLRLGVCAHPHGVEGSDKLDQGENAAAWAIRDAELDVLDGLSEPAQLHVAQGDRIPQH